MNKTIKIFIIILLISVTIAGCIYGIAVLLNKDKEDDSDSAVIKDYDLDAIYSDELTSKYKDIRDLPEEYDNEYNIGEAQKDGCLVLGAMVHNEDALSIFIDKYNRKESAFIRVVQRNERSEVYITDLLYDSKADVIYCVTDKTRDSGINTNQRKIKLEKYEHMDKYLFYNDHEYWVLYNGEHPGDNKTEKIKEKIDAGSLYIVSQIV